MSKSDLNKIFPLKVFLIALSLCAPLILFGVMVAFGIGTGREGRADWNDPFSRELMISAIVTVIVYAISLITGWLVYINKRKKLLNNKEN